MEETDALRKELRERGINYTIMDWGNRDNHTMFYLDIGGVTCVADYYESKGGFVPGKWLTIEPCDGCGHDKVLKLIDGVMGR